MKTTTRTVSTYYLALEDGTALCGCADQADGERMIKELDIIPKGVIVVKETTVTTTEKVG